MTAATTNPFINYDKECSDKFSSGGVLTTMTDEDWKALEESLEEKRRRDNLK
jgi:hypothetical protein